jgi:hypothetical protein
MQGLTLSIVNRVDVLSGSLSTACSADVQGVFMYVVSSGRARCIPLHHLQSGRTCVSLSTTYSMDVQGVSIYTASSVDE